MGFIRGFSRGKILSVQSEKFFQSGVKDSFSLSEKFFQSQGKVFSVQSEKIFQSEPRKKRADGLNRLLVIGNAAERSGELVIKVQQRKGGHIIPPSRANTSAARLYNPVVYQGFNCLPNGRQGNAHFFGDVLPIIDAIHAIGICESVPVSVRIAQLPAVIDQAESVARGHVEPLKGPDCPWNHRV